MTALFIILAIWVLGIFPAYKFFISKWNNTKFEKVWFSCIWPLLLPLYAVHYIHMKF